MNIQERIVVEIKENVANLQVLVIPSWFPTNNNRLGSYFEEQFLLLKRNGFNVALYYPEIKEQTKKDFIKRLFKQGIKSIVVENITDGLNKEIEGEACRIYDYTFFPTTIRYKIMQYIVVKRVMDFCRKQNFKPDIVHGFSAFGAGMHTVDIAKQMQAKSIITEHQVFNLSYYSKVYQQKIIDTLMNVDVLNAVSNHLIRLMVSQYIHRPIAIFNNYIQDVFFENNKPKKISTPLMIAYVSYNEFIKGDTVFLESIRLLNEKYNIKIHVSIVGEYDADKKDSIQKFFKQEDIGTCEFCGKIAEVELNAVFLKSHLLVSTSRAETFGMAVREALAAGLPVVCTRSGGVDEEITVDNGCLVNIDDVNGIAESIMHVNENYHQYSSKEISQRIYDKYSSYATLSNFKKLYNNIR